VYALISSLALISIHKSPAIPLAEICERYFNLSYEEALRKAARNELPVPTFRLVASRKAPLLVSAEALGAWIDKNETEARVLWERSRT